MEDTEGEYSFNDVRKSPLADKFHYYAPKTQKHDYTIHGYWFRYLLKNTMDHDAIICLGDTIFSIVPFFVPQNETSAFYFVNQDGKVTHQDQNNEIVAHRQSLNSQVQKQTTNGLLF